MGNTQTQYGECEKRMNYTSVLTTIIDSLKSRFPEVKIVSRYCGEALPFPLRQTAISIGIKSLKIRHTSLGSNENFSMDAVFIFEIFAPSAAQCYEMLDELGGKLLTGQTTPPFSSVSVGEVAYQSETAMYRLPTLGAIRWETKGVV